MQLKHAYALIVYCIEKEGRPRMVVMNIYKIIKLERWAQ